MLFFLFLKRYGRAGAVYTIISCFVQCHYCYKKLIKPNIYDDACFQTQKVFLDVIRKASNPTNTQQTAPIYQYSIVVSLKPEKMETHQCRSLCRSTWIYSDSGRTAWKAKKKKTILQSVTRAQLLKTQRCQLSETGSNSGGTSDRSYKEANGALLGY